MAGFPTSDELAQKHNLSETDAAALQELVINMLAMLQATRVESPDSEAMQARVEIQEKRLDTASPKVLEAYTDFLIQCQIILEPAST